MEREKEVGEGEEQKQEEKIYPNYIYRNREVTNKIRIAIKNTPAFYKKGVGKIKNQRILRALNFD